MASATSSDHGFPGLGDLFSGGNSGRDAKETLTAALSGTQAALLSESELAYGVAQCASRVPPTDAKFASRAKRTNNRDASNGQAIVVRHATVWDGLGGVHEDTDVLLVNGLIHAVGKDLEVPPDHPAAGELKEIDAKGRILTPGIVDMHSHAGTDSFPSLQGTSDTNDFGNPNLPHMQSFDSFHPHDTALPLILSGGITTILVLPGSANLQGGEAFAVKTPQKATNSAEDMLVNANISRTDPDAVYSTGGPYWRWAKQACGENPKRVYGAGGQFPFTRMGNAFLLRENYAKAAALRDAQDEWCRIVPALGLHAAVDTTSHKKKHAAAGYLHPKGRFPQDLHLEQVVALLRGQVKLNWHCYEVHDIETQMRIAREYNVSIAAFHHALSIHQLVPSLQRWNAEGRPPIGAAIFSDHWGYKREAYEASVYAAQILEKAGVPFAFKSDHPVLHSQYLVHESARAIQYGLPEQSVLRALTSSPAKLLGLDHRVGSVEVGKDADLVLWPTNPFTVGSLPDTVIVDGAVAFEKTVKEATDLKPEPNTPVPARQAIVAANSGGDIVITNIGKIVTGKETITGPTQLRLSNGKIACIGDSCDSTTLSAVAAVQTLDLQGGTITPPLVAAHTVLGLEEIAQEPVTHAGVAKADSPFPLVYARDGIQAGGRMERASANQGVGLGISAIQTTGDAVGVSVSALFATNHSTPLILSEIAAVHTGIGEDAKRDGSIKGSVAGQVAALRSWLTAPLPSPDFTAKGVAGPPSADDIAVVNHVRAGYIPLVIQTESANSISPVLRLKRAVDPKNQQRWVLAGAAEAHLVIDDLAAFNGTVSVLLNPARCIPQKWSSRRCLSPPHAYRGAQHVAALLKKYKVPFALSAHPEELASVRNLRFEAGWIRRLAGLSEQEMVASVTSSVLEVMTGSKNPHPHSADAKDMLQIGGNARFNAWNGDFGELTTQLLFAVDGASEAVVNYPVHE
ncbi:hypothetical protein BC828DRAFT_348638 [Blastocladiella britannica]|nr:hypothetical protein BC828DRAFT_348638 [Blastocladiella britannica]